MIDVVEPVPGHTMKRASREIMGIMSAGSSRWKILIAVVIPVTRCRFVVSPFEHPVIKARVGEHAPPTNSAGPWDDERT